MTGLTQLAHCAFGRAVLYFQLCADLPRVARQIRTQEEMGNRMTTPLACLKVLDFSTLLPVPFATMFLADLGADVVRMESPHQQDIVRAMPPFDGETSA